MIWCPRGDSNPQAEAYEPQSYVYTSSTTWAMTKTICIFNLISRSIFVVYNIIVLYYYTTMKRGKSFLLHLLAFIAIEVIFVLILFREWPETNLYTMIGILHTSYRAILIIAGWMRERLARVWQKFLATYIPVLYHLAIHVYVAVEAVHLHHEEHHGEHDMIWIFIGAVLLGILIYVGETLLHRKIHCDTHHADAHNHCHDEDCEQQH